jgi:hypothetical protein
MRTLRLVVILLKVTWIERKLRGQRLNRESTRAMKLKVPPDWRLTWLLLGVAIGLLALLVIELAQRYQ